VSKHYISLYIFRVSQKLTLQERIFDYWARLLIVCSIKQKQNLSEIKAVYILTQIG